MNEQQYKMEESLGYITGRTARALGTRVNRNFSDAGHDVTCEQWSVLVHLWRENGQNQQDLATTSCKNKTSMTRLINNMEKHGLVLRVSNKQDRRQKQVYLTKKGRNLQAKLLKIVRRTLEDAQRNISHKDIALCKDVLNRIYENAKL